MRSYVKCKIQQRLLDFFRSILVAKSNSEIEELIKKYENQIKEIKYNLYKLGWFMRGFMDYNTIMHVISPEDIRILNDIVKENLETTKESGMPFF